MWLNSCWEIFFVKIFYFRSYGLIFKFHTRHRVVIEWGDYFFGKLDHVEFTTRVTHPTGDIEVVARITSDT